MSVFPSFFMDCVVAIGSDAEDGVSWCASGFLFGVPAPQTEPDKKNYWVYLVTNRHVFADMRAAVLRFNPRSKMPAREYALDLTAADGSLLWFAHPNPRIDVAVVPINFAMLKKHAMQVSFFASDEHCAGLAQLRQTGVAEGDVAYILGFPMGLVGGRRNLVIVRSGTIARIRDTVDRRNGEFLLDAFVFPGNSGGPVLLAVASEVSGGLGAVLVGIVKHYVPYQDIAVSSQTMRPRVIFEENSGLCAAHPIDYVKLTIKRHLQSLESSKRAKKH